MTQFAVYSPVRNRIYLRKFDHDEALRRFEAGETIHDLAIDYGVFDGAVARVVDLDARQRMDEASYRNSHTTCERCGRPCLKATNKARRTVAQALCATCIARDRRECVRVDEDGNVLEIKCVTCKEWKEPAAFGRGQRYKDLRDGGFHNTCRPCIVILRTNYRKRHRVPCEAGCGGTTEGRGRPNTASDSKNPGQRRRLDPDRPYLCARCGTIPAIRDAVRKEKAA